MLCGALLRREMLQLHPATVNFAALLELRGLRVVLRDSRLEIGLRCRLLRQLPGPLAFFFHAQGESESRVVLDDLVSTFRGDDLLIAVEQNIGPGCTQVRLGFCDLPVCASSLPVTSDYAAVHARCNEPPPTELLYSFAWPVLQTCGTAWERGVELVAYSLQRLDETVWVRLRWRIPSHPSRRLRVVGSILPSEATFDREISAEQNIICHAPVATLEEMFFRVGVFDPQAKRLLQVGGGSYVFLPFPARTSRVGRNPEALRGGASIP